MTWKRFKEPFVIAEIGCNHKGDFEIAKEMIVTAKIFCQVDAVKFQKRTVNHMLSEEEYNKPHPIPYNSYGSTYGEHREFLEFTVEQHRELKKLCEEMDIIYSCSVWDLVAAKEIVSLNPQFIKIPSALNTNFSLLEWTIDNYLGDIHLSLGMTTEDEIESIIRFFIDKKAAHRLVIYHCTSGYPIEFNEVKLLEITNLIEKYGSFVKNIGYSGHHHGIAVDDSAYTLGANVIERHYTLNRTWKGTDHSASLEPDGLRRVKRNLMSLREAFNYKEQDILDIEVEQRRKLKWDRNTKQ